VSFAGAKIRREGERRLLAEQKREKRFLEATPRVLNSIGFWLDGIASLPKYGIRPAGHFTVVMRITFCITGKLRFHPLAIANGCIRVAA
jgi:hypothetical protein